VVALIVEPDDIPSAELSPHVQLNGTDFEIVPPIPGRDFFTLLGPNGGAHYVRPILEKGVGPALLWVNDGKKNLSDEDRRPLLVAEDGAGGLTRVRRFSPQWRAAVNVALAAAGKPLIPEPPRAPADAPRLEIPLTRTGWHDAAVELRARLVTASDGDPVTLATPCGDLSVVVRDDSFGESGLPYTALLEVSGKLTIGKSTYTISGDPAFLSRIRNEAGDRRISRDREAQITGIIKAAWAADGEHTAVRDLAGAAGDADQADRTLGADWDPSDTRDHAARARGHLLQLGTADLPVKAREFALASIESGFIGSIQDLRDAVTALFTTPGE